MCSSGLLFTKIILTSRFDASDMLPQKHFLISALGIVPVALVFFPELTLAGVVLWVFFGGLWAAAIDTDIVVLTFLKSKEDDRLKPFRNMWEINRNFSLFMDTTYETGILKIAMQTHLLLSALFILVVYLFSNAYFVPVALGVVLHLVSDIPNYKMVFF